MPSEDAPEGLDFDFLATYLKALAHPGRLEILWRLRHPTRAADVEVRPRRRDDLQPDRPMTRQTVEEHLEKLLAAGVVTRLPEAGGGADRWVTNVPQIFAVVEELRLLTAIPPAPRLELDETVTTEQMTSGSWTPGPKLALVTGPWLGRAFRLDGPGPWTIGRSRSRDVALSYDPFVSVDHARVERGDDAFAIRATVEPRNPASVNFLALGPGERRALQHGDVLMIGRSVLVFRER